MAKEVLKQPGPSGSQSPGALQQILYLCYTTVLGILVILLYYSVQGRIKPSLASGRGITLPFLGWGTPGMIGRYWALMACGWGQVSWGQVGDRLVGVRLVGVRLGLDWGQVRSAARFKFGLGYVCYHGQVWSVWLGQVCYHSLVGFDWGQVKSAAWVKLSLLPQIELG